MIRTRTALLTSLATVLAVVAVSGASAATESSWFWTAPYAQKHLAGQTIRWTSVRIDAVVSAACSPIGRWLSPQQSSKFHHFVCTVSARGRAPYLVLATPSSKTSLTVAWIGYPGSPQWYWTTQRAANALATDGVRWPSGTDRVLNDSCVSIGPAHGGMYANFDCAVGTPRSADGKYGYQVLIHVTGRSSYSLAYVDDDAVAGPLSGNQGAISGSYDASLTTMTLTTAWWNNMILFGTPFPHPNP